MQRPRLDLAGAAYGHNLTSMHHDLTMRRWRPVILVRSYVDGKLLTWGDAKTIMQGTDGSQVGQLKKRTTHRHITAVDPLPTAERPAFDSAEQS